MDSPKVAVSPEWTNKERRAVAVLIERELQALQETETEMRKTIKYRAPCLEQNAAEQQDLDELLRALRGFSASMLEANRDNFAKYLAE